MFQHVSNGRTAGLNKLNFCLASTCAIIVFLLLATLIVHRPFNNDPLTVRKKYLTSHSEDDFRLYWNDPQNIDSTFIPTSNACNLIVCDVDSNKIDSAFSQLAETNIECKEKRINTKLQNIKYSNQTIGRHWLHTDVKISNLIITSNNCITITPSSFSDIQFKELRSLFLSNISIADNKIASPVSEQTVPVLSQSVSFIGLFRNFNKTLTKLSIRHMHGVGITEIIGNVVLPSLKAINLEDSKLKDGSITKFDFVNIRNITWLRLFNCKLQIIGADAFFFIRKTIQEIDIRHNRLLRLPEGLFDSMLNKRYDLFVHLEENPWMCSCNDLSITFDRAACLSRINCGIESVTSPYGLTARNQRSKQTIDVECVDYEDSSIIETIQVQCRDHDMEITAVNRTAVKIEFEMDLPNFILLWFNDSLLRSAEEYVMTVSDINCMSPLSQITYIDGLASDLTYTFCIMENTSVSMSPFNCAAFYIPPEDDGDSMWIAKEHKTKIILFAIGIFVLFVCIGIMTGIWLVRRKPMWLGDSKNLIMPSNKNSLVDTISTGFATDSCQANMGNEDYRGYMEQRRHSGTSIKSFKEYEVALNPSRFDIVKARLEKAQYEHKYYSENTPKLPPPEPPRSKYHANLYISFDDARPKITSCIDDFNLDGLYAKCGSTYAK